MVLCCGLQTTTCVEYLLCKQWGTKCSRFIDRCESYSSPSRWVSPSPLLRWAHWSSEELNNWHRDVVWEAAGANLQPKSRKLRHVGNKPPSSASGQTPWVNKKNLHLMGWKWPWKVFESSLVHSSMFMSLRLDQGYYLMTPGCVQQSFLVSGLHGTEIYE